MRVIISGGSGLIGRVLTDNFIAGGHEVEIISRKPDKLKNFPKGVKAFGWNENELAENLEGADAIVNLVGASIAGVL
jgi:NAD dependent epimerase/dehydratase family enzyme